MPIEYYVVEKVNNVTTTLQTYTEIETAKDAARRLRDSAKEINKIATYRIVKRIIELEWQAREEAKFASGEYKTVPWHLSSCLIKQHYTHVSKLNPLKVAFIKNEEDGESGKYTQMSPQTYLIRYYREVYSDNTINNYTNSFIEQNYVANLNIATSRDEILWVYTHGPSSCMTSTSPLPMHPVCVYADSDLAIAYIKNVRGRVRARCVVWPEKKIWGRIYGDVHLMINILVNAGYTRGPGKWYRHGESSMAGAKLPKHVYNDLWLIMPYLDMPTRYVAYYDDKYVVLSENVGRKTTTSGFITAPPKE